MGFQFVTEGYGAPPIHLLTHRPYEFLAPMMTRFWQRTPIANDSASKLSSELESEDAELKAITWQKTLIKLKLNI
jgi:hypothetical protein